MDLATNIYQATESFPSRELYGLTNQLRRASISIPSNIAEGQARFSKRDFAHYLRQAMGSLAEVETQILLSQRLKYLKDPETEKLLESSGELGRILNGLIDSQLS
jgi:four helix bundle protein